MANELGLYYPNGAFRSEAEIKRQLAYKEPLMVTPVIQGEVFNYWSTRFAERADQVKSQKERTRTAEIQLADTSLISFFGASVILTKGHKQVMPFYDILETHEQFKRM